MKKYILLYICILLFAISCKKDENPGTPSGGSFPILNSYPLQLGNEWKYHTTVSFTSNSFNAFFNDYSTNRFDSITSFGAYDSVFALVAIDSTDDGAVYQSTNYYFQNSTGLFNAGYLYVSNPRVFLRETNEIKFKIENIVFDNLDEVSRFFLNSITDSLIIENPPLKTLCFPSIQNQKWSYRDYGNPIYLGKSYEGFANIQTNFGSFICQKIKFHYDFNNDSITDPDINIYQYISATKGLLRSTQNVKIFLTDNIGTVIDTGYYYQNSIATSINF